MNVQTIVRGRMLPGCLLIAGFTLGCTPLSSFVVRNDSSQTIAVEGTHTGSARARASLVLPPGGSGRLSVSESGKFTGSVQADTQRWSTGELAREQGSAELLTFIDDPDQPGRLRMLQAFRAIRPRPLQQGVHTAESPDEWVIVNQTAADILMIELSRANAPGVIIPAMHSAVLPYSPTGARRWGTIRDQRVSEIIIPADSDRTFIVQ